MPFEIHEMRAKPDGFELTFTQAGRSRRRPASPTSYAMKTYTYIYQADYGSPEVDHTTPTITKIEVGRDKKSVRLHWSALQEGHVHELHGLGVKRGGGSRCCTRKRITR